MSWANRAATNILPLSREEDNLAVALHERRYVGDCNDLKASLETYKLFDHPEAAEVSRMVVGLRNNLLAMRLMNREDQAVV